MTQAPHSANASPLATLGDSINRMDALAQHGFSAVAKTARQALQGLNASGSTQSHPEAIADALATIWRLAEQFGNDVNVAAEEAGHNFLADRGVSLAIRTRA